MTLRCASLLAAALLSPLGSACAAANPPPASRAVQAFARALESSDPHVAYDMLSARARRHLSYKGFAAEWTATRAERAWQRERMIEALRGAPDVSEHASVAFTDGKLVPLEREQGRWTLHSPLASRVRITRPEQAVRMFAEAIAHRDLEALLRTLTLERRESIGRGLAGFWRGLSRRGGAALETVGDNQAELRWDDSGMRFRIVLRKEDDEWRVDDIHIHPAPPTGSSGSDAGDDWGF